jgi:hypothetical protein
MLFVTSKFRVFLVLLAALVGAAPALAAPTEFNSPNYTVGSVIFGGTGTLRFPQSSSPPVILTGPTVGNITTTSANVKWTTDRNTTGIVFVGTSSGTYTFQAGDAFTPTITDHSVDLNFLVRGTHYFYKVRSVDNFGNAVESAEGQFDSDPGDITPPVITSGPTASQNSGSQVTISWTTDEVSNSVVDYGISDVTQFSAGHTDERTLFHQVTLIGLGGNQTYQYRVKSKDGSDNQVTSATDTFTTVASPTITEVKITDVTLSSAVVQWKTTVATTTTVNYGITSGKYTVNNDDASLTETHVVRLSALASGTIYYIRLSGADASGSRITSDEYLFKTVILPRIDDFEIFDIQSRSVNLRWTASAEVDAFVRYEITASDTKELIGKKFATGDDKLALEHAIQLPDLEPSTVYSVTVQGKDVFGNQAVSPTKSFTTLPDHDPPVIENLRSDTTVDLGSRQTVQVLISFGTNEPAKAVVEYGDGAAGPYNKKIDNDTDFTKNKFLVIPALKPGNSYHFIIHVTDQSGNTADSADYLVLAPAQPKNFLSLILDQLKLNFGWLTTIGSGGVK